VLECDDPQANFAARMKRDEHIHIAARPRIVTGITAEEFQASDIKFAADRIQPTLINV